MQYEIIGRILDYYDSTGKWMSVSRIYDYFGINKRFAAKCLEQAKGGFTIK